MRKLVSLEDWIIWGTTRGTRGEEEDTVSEQADIA
jgi:hypothetical protein